MFFIAAALVLTTAGVFAGKAKFNTTMALYASPDGTSNWYPISSGSVSFVDLQQTKPIPTAQQSTITDYNGTQVGLYYFVSGTTYSANVYSTVPF